MAKKTIMEVSIVINGTPCTTPAGAAARIGCSVPTLARRVRDGLLTPIREHGRTWYSIAAVDAMIRAEGRA